MWFDPELLLFFTERFRSKLGELGFALSNDIRLAYIRSQLTLDVSAAAGVLQFPHMLGTDPVTAVTGPFVLTAEPTLQRGQPLNTDQALGIVGGWMGFKANRAFALDPDEPNIIYDALSDGQLRGVVTNKTLIGPIQWEPHVDGGPSARASELNAGANDQIGGVENRMRPWVLPDPQVVAPNTQLNFTSEFNGAFINANVANDFLVNLTLVTLVADRA